MKLCELKPNSHIELSSWLWSTQHYSVCIILCHTKASVLLNFHAFNVCCSLVKIFTVCLSKQHDLYTSIDWTVLCGLQALLVAWQWVWPMGVTVYILYIRTYLHSMHALDRMTSRKCSPISSVCSSLKFVTVLETLVLSSACGGELIKVSDVWDYVNSKI